MGEVFWILLCVALLLVVLIYYRWPGRAAFREGRFARARCDFHTRREWLEAKFIQLAAGRSQSRCLRWLDCNFADDVAYVRHRGTGEISALVAIAIANDDPEEYPAAGGDAIGNLQLGTAIFRWDRGHWITEGRAILNLSPAETVHCFERDYEFLGEEFAQTKP